MLPNSSPCTRGRRVSDEIDWSVTTWDGNRLRQHREFLALPFREKMRWLEDLAQVAERLRPAPVESPPTNED
jgi:hypothetical protein